MATTVKTPTHTDPETKKKEDKNETTIKQAFGQKHQDPEEIS
jgi:hypothetical protein